MYSHLTMERYGLLESHQTSTYRAMSLSSSLSSYLIMALPLIRKVFESVMYKACIRPGVSLVSNPLLKFSLPYRIYHSHTNTPKYTSTPASLIRYLHLLFLAYYFLSSQSYKVTTSEYNQLGTMTKDRRIGTRHHCPKRNGREGPCNERVPVGSISKYCTNHQVKCPVPGCDQIHLKTEPCKSCTLGNVHGGQREKEAQAKEEKKRAEQRERDELLGRNPNAPKNKKGR